MACDEEKIPNVAAVSETLAIQSVIFLDFTFPSFALYVL